ncbi:hypothetical protein ACA910_007052 [Epithemia clementina (nom. ined.)]
MRESGEFRGNDKASRGGCGGETKDQFPNQSEVKQEHQQELQRLEQAQEKGVPYFSSSSRFFSSSLRSRKEKNQTDNSLNNNELRSPQLLKKQLRLVSSSIPPSPPTSPDSKAAPPTTSLFALTYSPMPPSSTKKRVADEGTLYGIERERDGHQQQLQKQKFTTKYTPTPTPKPPPVGKPPLPKHEPVEQQLKQAHVSKLPLRKDPYPKQPPFKEVTEKKRQQQQLPQRMPVRQKTTTKTGVVSPSLLKKKLRSSTSPALPLLMAEEAKNATRAVLEHLLEHKQQAEEEQQPNFKPNAQLETTATRTEEKSHEMEETKRSPTSASALLELQHHQTSDGENKATLEANEEQTRELGKGPKREKNDEPTQQINQESKQENKQEQEQPGHDKTETPLCCQDLPKRQSRWQIPLLVDQVEDQQRKEDQSSQPPQQQTPSEDQDVLVSPRLVRDKDCLSLASSSKTPSSTVSIEQLGEPKLTTRAALDHLLLQHPIDEAAVHPLNQQRLRLEKEMELRAGLNNTIAASIPTMPVSPKSLDKEKGSKHDDGKRTPSFPGQNQSLVTKDHLSHDTKHSTAAQSRAGIIIDHQEHNHLRLCLNEQVRRWVNQGFVPACSTSMTADIALASMPNWQMIWANTLRVILVSESNSVLYSNDRLRFIQMLEQGWVTQMSSNESCGNRPLGIQQQSNYKQTLLHGEATASNEANCSSQCEKSPREPINTFFGIEEPTPTRFDQSNEDTLEDEKKEEEEVSLERRHSGFAIKIGCEGIENRFEEEGTNGDHENETLVNPRHDRNQTTKASSPNRLDDLEYQKYCSYHEDSSSNNVQEPVQLDEVRCDQCDGENQTAGTNELPDPCAIRPSSAGLSDTHSDEDDATNEEKSAHLCKIQGVVASTSHQVNVKQHEDNEQKFQCNIASFHDGSQDLLQRSLQDGIRDKMDISKYCPDQCYPDNPDKESQEHSSKDFGEPEMGKAESQCVGEATLSDAARMDWKAFLQSHSFPLVLLFVEDVNHSRSMVPTMELEGARRTKPGGTRYVEPKKLKTCFREAVSTGHTVNCEDSEEVQVTLSESVPASTETRLRRRKQVTIDPSCTTQSSKTEKCKNELATQDSPFMLLSFDELFSSRKHNYLDVSEHGNSNEELSKEIQATENDSKTEESMFSIAEDIFAETRKEFCSNAMEKISSAISSVERFVFTVLDLKDGSCCSEQEGSVLLSHGPAPFAEVGSAIVASAADALNFLAKHMSLHRSGFVNDAILPRNDSCVDELRRIVVVDRLRGTEGVVSKGMIALNVEAHKILSRHGHLGSMGPQSYTVPFIGTGAMSAATIIFQLAQSLKTRRILGQEDFAHSKEKGQSAVLAERSIILRLAGNKTAFNIFSWDDSLRSTKRTCMDGLRRFVRGQKTKNFVPSVPTIVVTTWIKVLSFVSNAIRWNPYDSLIFQFHGVIGSGKGISTETLIAIKIIWQLQKSRTTLHLGSLEDFVRSKKGRCLKELRGFAHECQSAGGLEAIVPTEMITCVNLTTQLGSVDEGLTDESKSASSLINNRQPEKRPPLMPFHTAETDKIKHTENKHAVQDDERDTRIRQIELRLVKLRYRHCLDELLDKADVSKRAVANDKKQACKTQPSNAEIQKNTMPVRNVNWAPFTTETITFDDDDWDREISNGISMDAGWDNLSCLNVIAAGLGIEMGLVGRLRLRAKSMLSDSEDEDEEDELANFIAEMHDGAVERVGGTAASEIKGGDVATDDDESKVVLDEATDQGEESEEEDEESDDEITDTVEHVTESLPISKSSVDETDKESVVSQHDKPNEALDDTSLYEVVSTSNDETDRESNGLPYSDTGSNTGMFTKSGGASSRESAIHTDIYSTDTLDAILDGDDSDEEEDDDSAFEPLENEDIDAFSSFSASMITVNTNQVAGPIKVTCSVSLPAMFRPLFSGGQRTPARQNKKKK